MAKLGSYHNLDCKFINYLFGVLNYYYWYQNFKLYYNEN